MTKFRYLVPVLILSSVLGITAATGAGVTNGAGINLENPLISVAAPAATRTYLNVNPLDMVNNPSFYLNKYVRIKAKFDKYEKK